MDFCVIDPCPAAPQGLPLPALAPGERLKTDWALGLSVDLDGDGQADVISVERTLDIGIHTEDDVLLQRLPGGWVEIAQDRFTR
jgi:hypothetical protein